MTMKQLALSFIRQSHAFLACGAMPERLAVYFHELEEPDWPAFADAMRYFTEEGYRTVRAETFADPDAEGRMMFLSFDDNFKSWHRALPLMDDLGVTATFYVNSAPFRDVADLARIDRYFDVIRHKGERLTLTRRELLDIAAAGHTIGAHTHSHPVLSDLPRSQWHSEIDRNKAILEDCLGTPVTDFSFPFGMPRHFSPDLSAYCQALGIRTIATGLSGLQHLSPVDPFQIHRTGWKFGLSLEDNLVNLRIDGRLYARTTGRSVIG